MYMFDGKISVFNHQVNLQAALNTKELFLSYIDLREVITGQQNSSSYQIFNPFMFQPQSK